jgi:hypothetical protein
VNVELQLEQIPVLKAHEAQLAGQAKQLLTPSLYWPDKQLIISTHLFEVASNH